MEPELPPSGQAEWEIEREAEEMSAQDIEPQVATEPHVAEPKAPTVLVPADLPGRLADYRSTRTRLNRRRDRDDGAARDESHGRTYQLTQSQS